MKDTEAMLEFVTAEEAAKWPEGTWFVHAVTGPYGYPVYTAETVGSDGIGWLLDSRTHFARLPDTLPDLSEEPSDVR